MTKKASTPRRGRTLAGMFAGGLALGLVPFAAPASAQTDPLPAARNLLQGACPGTPDDTTMTGDQSTTQVPEDGFTDVPSTNVHEYSIDCVVWYEVASGVTATTYNPAGTVKREQMATFIAQLVDYAADEANDSTPDTGTPPTDEDDVPALPAAGTTNRFPCDVVTTSTHFDNIQRLAAANIVEGTGTADGEACFNPGGNVTRAQMATFLKNAQDFIGVDLVAVTEDYFADIAGDTHEDNINIIADEAVARGTGTNANNEAIYSPGAFVRRDQMASFLANKLDRLVNPNKDAIADNGLIDPPPSVSVSVTDDTVDPGEAIVPVTVTALRDTIESVDISGCSVPTVTPPIANAPVDDSQTVNIAILPTQPAGPCTLTVVVELTGGRTVTTSLQLTINAV